MSETILWLAILALSIYCLWHMTRARTCELWMIALAEQNHELRCQLDIAITRAARMHAERDLERHRADRLGYQWTHPLNLRN